MEQPTLASLAAQVADLQHQSGTILLLSSVNMFMNVATIAFGFFIAL